MAQRNIILYFDYAHKDAKKCHMDGWKFPQTASLANEDQTGEKKQEVERGRKHSMLISSK
jgi:hypothetical protein